jgi:hypothetical protein
MLAICRQQQLSSSDIVIAIEGTMANGARRMISKLTSNNTTTTVTSSTNVLFWSVLLRVNHLMPVVVDNSDDDYDDYEFIKKNENTQTSCRNSNRSLLQRPFRIQGKGGSTYNLCYAIAVTAALVGLGLTHNDGHWILNLVQKKMNNTTFQYQGKTCNF